MAGDHRWSNQPQTPDQPLSGLGFMAGVKPLLPPLPPLGYSWLEFPLWLLAQLYELEDVSSLKDYLNVFELWKSTISQIESADQASNDRFGFSDSQGYFWDDFGADSRDLAITVPESRNQQDIGLGGLEVLGQGVDKWADRQVPGGLVDSQARLERPERTDPPRSNEEHLPDFQSLGQSLFEQRTHNQEPLGHVGISSIDALPEVIASGSPPLQEQELFTTQLPQSPNVELEGNNREGLAATSGLARLEDSSPQRNIPVLEPKVIYDLKTPGVLEAEFLFSQDLAANPQLANLVQAEVSQQSIAEISSLLEPELESGDLERAAESDFQPTNIPAAAEFLPIAADTELSIVPTYEPGVSGEISSLDIVDDAEFETSADIAVVSDAEQSAIFPAVDADTALTETQAQEAILEATVSPESAVVNNDNDVADGDENSATVEIPYEPENLASDQPAALIPIEPSDISSIAVSLTPEDVVENLTTQPTAPVQESPPEWADIVVSEPIVEDAPIADVPIAEAPIAEVPEATAPSQASDTPSSPIITNEAESSASRPSNPLLRGLEWLKSQFSANNQPEEQSRVAREVNEGLSRAETRSREQEPLASLQTDPSSTVGQREQEESEVSSQEPLVSSSPEISAPDQPDPLAQIEPAALEVSNFNQPSLEAPIPGSQLQESISQDSPSIGAFPEAVPQPEAISDTSPNLPPQAVEQPVEQPIESLPAATEAIIPAPVNREDIGYQAEGNLLEQEENSIQGAASPSAPRPEQEVFTPPPTQGDLINVPTSASLEEVRFPIEDEQSVSHEDISSNELQGAISLDTSNLESQLGEPEQTIEPGDLSQPASSTLPESRQEDTQPLAAIEPVFVEVFGASDVNIPSADDPTSLSQPAVTAQSDLDDVAIERVSDSPEAPERSSQLQEANDEEQLQPQSLDGIQGIQDDSLGQPGLDVLAGNTERPEAPLKSPLLSPQDSILTPTREDGEDLTRPSIIDETQEPLPQSDLRQEERTVISTDADGFREIAPTTIPEQAAQLREEAITAAPQSEVIPDSPLNLPSQEEGQPGEILTGESSETEMLASVAPTLEDIEVQPETINSPEQEPEEISPGDASRFEVLLNFDDSSSPVPIAPQESLQEDVPPLDGITPAQTRIDEALDGGQPGIEERASIQEPSERFEQLPTAPSTAVGQSEPDEGEVSRQEPPAANSPDISALDQPAPSSQIEPAALEVSSFNQPPLEAPIPGSQLQESISQDSPSIDAAPEAVPQPEVISDTNLPPQAVEQSVEQPIESLPAATEASEALTPTPVNREDIGYQAEGGLLEQEEISVQDAASPSDLSPEQEVFTPPPAQSDSINVPESASLDEISPPVEDERSVLHEDISSNELPGVIALDASTSSPQFGESERIIEPGDLSQPVPITLPESRQEDTQQPTAIEPSFVEVSNASDINIPSTDDFTSLSQPTVAAQNDVNEDSTNERISGAPEAPEGRSQLLEVNEGDRRIEEQQLQPQPQDDSLERPRLDVLEGRTERPEAPLESSLSPNQDSIPSPTQGDSEDLNRPSTLAEVQESLPQDDLRQEERLAISPDIEGFQETAPSTIPEQAAQLQEEAITAAPQSEVISDLPLYLPSQEEEQLGEILVNDVSEVPTPPLVSQDDIESQPEIVNLSGQEQEEISRRDTFGRLEAVPNFDDSSPSVSTTPQESLAEDVPSLDGTTPIQARVDEALDVEQLEPGTAERVGSQEPSEQLQLDPSPAAGQREPDEGEASRQEPLVESPPEISDLEQLSTLVQLEPEALEVSSFNQPPLEEPPLEAPTPGSQLQESISQDSPSIGTAPDAVPLPERVADTSPNLPPQSVVQPVEPPIESSPEASEAITPTPVNQEDIGYQVEGDLLEQEEISVQDVASPSDTHSEQEVFTPPPAQSDSINVPESASFEEVSPPIEDERRTPYEDVSSNELTGVISSDTSTSNPELGESERTVEPGDLSQPAPNIPPELRREDTQQPNGIASTLVDVSDTSEASDVYIPSADSPTPLSQPTVAVQSDFNEDLTAEHFSDVPETPEMQSQLLGANEGGRQLEEQQLQPQPQPPDGIQDNSLEQPRLSVSDERTERPEAPLESSFSPNQDSIPSPTQGDGEDLTRPSTLAEVQKLLPQDDLRQEERTAISSDAEGFQEIAPTTIPGQETQPQEEAITAAPQSEVISDLPLNLPPQEDGQPGEILVNDAPEVPAPPLANQDEIESQSETANLSEQDSEENSHQDAFNRSEAISNFDDSRSSATIQPQASLAEDVPPLDETTPIQARVDDNLDSEQQSGIEERAGAQESSEQLPTDPSPTFEPREPDEGEVNRQEPIAVDSSRPDPPSYQPDNLNLDAFSGTPETPVDSLNQPPLQASEQEIQPQEPISQESISIDADLEAQLPPGIAAGEELNLPPEAVEEPGESFTEAPEILPPTPASLDDIGYQTETGNLSEPEEAGYQDTLTPLDTSYEQEGYPAAPNINESVDIPSGTLVEEPSTRTLEDDDVPVQRLAVEPLGNAAEAQEEQRISLEVNDGDRQLEEQQPLPQNNLNQEQREVASTNFERVQESTSTVTPETTYSSQESVDAEPQATVVPEAALDGEEVAQPQDPADKDKVSEVQTSTDGAMGTGSEVNSPSLESLAPTYKFIIDDFRFSESLLSFASELDAQFESSEQRLENEPDLENSTPVFSDGDASVMPSESTWDKTNGSSEQTAPFDQLDRDENNEANLQEPLQNDDGVMDMPLVSPALGAGQAALGVTSWSSLEEFIAKLERETFNSFNSSDTGQTSSAGTWTNVTEFLKEFNVEFEPQNDSSPSQPFDSQSSQNINTPGLDDIIWLESDWGQNNASNRADTELDRQEEISQLIQYQYNLDQERDRLFSSRIAPFDGEIDLQYGSNEAREPELIMSLLSDSGDEDEDLEIDEWQVAKSLEYLMALKREQDGTLFRKKYE